MKKWYLSLIFTVIFVAPGFIPGNMRGTSPRATFYCYAQEPSMGKRYYGANWDFKKGEEGWQSTHSVSSFSATKDGIKFSVTGSDPYIIGPETEIDAKYYQFITIRMKTTKPVTAGSFYWRTDVSPDLSKPPKNLGFEVKSDGEFHTYDIFVGGHKDWNGKILQLRLDPEPPESTGADVEIEYIKVFKEGPKVSFSGGVSNGLVITGKPFKINSEVKSVGGEDAFDIKAELKLTKDISLTGGDLIQGVSKLAVKETAAFSWEASCNKEGIYDVILKISGKDISPSEQPMKIFVVSKPPVVPDKKPGKTQVYSDDVKNVILENQKMRIVFVRQPSGYFHYLIYCADDSGWFHLGAGYPMASIAYKSSSGSSEDILILPQSFEILKNDGREASVIFPALTKDKDGVQWFSSVKFTLKENGVHTSVESSIKSDKDRQVLKFTGPFIYGGEGSFGKDKDEAMFPGLEWLIGDEISSSELDIAPPKNIRHTPHPYKVTIPVMSVEYKKHLLGLMWDPMQKWDGKNICPSVRFFSPNWAESQDNHQMGIFLPSIPEWVEENGNKATSPYSLKADINLTLSSYIIAEYPQKPLFACLRYFDVFGKPMLQEKPMSYEEEVELSKYAYMESGIWDPQATGWGHVYKWKPAPYQFNILSLWMYSMSTKDATQKAKTRERANLVYNYITDEQGPQAIQPRLAFRMGSLEQSILNAGNGIKGLIGSQRKDGSWRFNPDAQRKVLGKPGAEEAGITAPNANVVLQYALMTGNQEALAKGLKAVESMDKFTVPRASQTWECPVHSPDILGSSRVMDSYLYAYRMTGEKKYLDKAIYWAWTGLPFVYFWGVEERPLMKYSTIPIFGATFFTGSWIGRPVQWNGLAYAYSLQKLWQYDKSFPWDTLAEGITISAMIQQEKDGIAKGCYPDYWDLPTNVSVGLGCSINPELIMWNVYNLLGEDPNVRTTIVEKDGMKVQVNSGANIADVKIDNTALKFNLNYFKDETSYSMIAGLDKPVKILYRSANLSGSLSEVDDLDKAKEGWKYGENGFLYIKVAHKAPQASIEIPNPVPVKPLEKVPAKSFDFVPKRVAELQAKPFKAIHEWDFSKPKSQDEWSDVSKNAMGDFDFSGKTLKVEFTKSDPYMYFPAIGFDAKEYPYLIIKMKATKAGGSGHQIFFITEDSSNWEEGKSVRGVAIADDKFHVNTFDMGKCGVWKGKITGLRIDLFNGKEEIGCVLEIEYIKIANKQMYEK